MSLFCSHAFYATCMFRSSISKSTYVIADTDSTSQKRFDAYETSLREKSASPTAACVPIYVTLPRSREVGQSYISSVGTTLYACYFAALIVFKTVRRSTSGTR